MEARQSGAGSLGTCVTLFRERAWPLPRTSYKADGAREDCRGRCRTGLRGQQSRGGFAVPASRYPISGWDQDGDPPLACPGLALLSLSGPIWEPQKSRTWLPGNMMPAHTALVSALNYLLK